VMVTAAAATRQRIKGNIRLKRLIQFHGSNSLGITLPADFVQKLGLIAGQFVKVEINKTGTSLTVEGIEICV
jgi:hypothetical protein